MAHVATAELRELVLELAGRFRIDNLSPNVEIESDEPSEDEQTLRIVLRVKNLQKANLVELQRFVSALEDSLSERDERFPSVRFAEAA